MSEGVFDSVRSLSLLHAFAATPKTERERLLHFVVVGGGPTGVESAAEFADFVKEDMAKFFPEVRPRLSQCRRRCVLSAAHSFAALRHFPCA